MDVFPAIVTMHLGRLVQIERMIGGVISGVLRCADYQRSGK